MSRASRQACARATEKIAIARAAASLVRPGTAIAVAAGPTTFALAQCLLDVPGLTIVTNSLAGDQLVQTAPAASTALPIRWC